MNKLKPVLTVFSAISILLGIIAAVWIVVAQGEVPAAEMKNARDVMRDYPSLSSGISLGLYESLILMIIAVAACLLAWIINTATNPKTGKSIFIGVIALVVLCRSLSYVLQCCWSLTNLICCEGSEKLMFLIQVSHAHGCQC